MGMFAALDQRIATRFTIKPMDLAESAAYLRHHLEAGRTRGTRCSPTTPSPGCTASPTACPAPSTTPPPPRSSPPRPPARTSSTMPAPRKPSPSSPETERQRPVLIDPSRLMNTERCPAMSRQRGRQHGSSPRRPRSESWTPPGGNSHRATRRRFALRRRHGSRGREPPTARMVLATPTGRRAPRETCVRTQPATTRSPLPRPSRPSVYSAPPAQSSATASCRRPAHNCLI